MLIKYFNQFRRFKGSIICLNYTIQTLKKNEYSFGIYKWFQSIKAYPDLISDTIYLIIE